MDSVFLNDFFDVVQRFWCYVQIDIQFDVFLDMMLFIVKQFDFGWLFEGELCEFGFDDVEFDENGYVYGILLVSVGVEQVLMVVLLVYMDILFDEFGGLVCLQFYFDYQGGCIELFGDFFVVFDFEWSFEFFDYFGYDLISSDGMMLFGLDDKVGIVIIVGILRKLIDDEVLL